VDVPFAWRVELWWREGRAKTSWSCGVWVRGSIGGEARRSFAGRAGQMQELARLVHVEVARDRAYKWLRARLLGDGRRAVLFCAEVGEAKHT
jgi:hypothetical protein